MFAQMIAFVRDEDGATAIEYGLIAALVSVAAIGALTAMGCRRVPRPASASIKRSRRSIS